MPTSGDDAKPRDPAAGGPGRPAWPDALWVPSLVFAAVPVYVIGRALTAHDFPARAYRAHDAALSALSAGCFLLAALLAAWAPLRRRAARHAESLGRGPRRRHVVSVAVAALGISCWLGFVRTCLYRNFAMPLDTADEVSRAYSLIHHGQLARPLEGILRLSTHFDLLMPLFAPVLFVWNDPLALILIENVLLCSLPAAAYCLAYGLTSSSLAGLTALLLAASTPYLYELLSASLHNNAVAALVPWALVFFQRKRWGLFAVCAGAALAGSEQMPLVLFGFGLYAVWALGWRKPRSWLAGLTLCALSVALWLGEVSLLTHFSRLEPQGTTFLDRARIFSRLAPQGTPTDSILWEAALHPLRTLFLTFDSAYRAGPALRLIFSLGLFCLLAPAHMLPFAIVLIPYVLGHPGDKTPLFGPLPPGGLSSFSFHYSAPVLGALVWATAHGLRRLYDRLSARDGRGWLLVWALFVSGFGFRWASRTLLPDWRRTWFDALPPLVASIPPKARVWADEYAAAPLSNRRWLKVVGWGPDEPSGYRLLFKPDFVLFDGTFLSAAQPPYRDRLLTFLDRGGYAPVSDDPYILLLKSPAPAPSPEEVPDRIELPAAEPARAAAYARRLSAHLAARRSPAQDQRALRYLRERVEDNPERAEARCQLASHLSSLGREDEAAAQYREALRLEPGSADAAIGLGVQAYKRGRPWEAASRFSSALRASPRHPRAHVNLGFILAGRGKLEEASRHYREALAADPGFAEAHNKLGIALSWQGRLEEAAAEFRRTLELAPGHPEASVNLPQVEGLLRQRR